MSESEGWAQFIYSFGWLVWILLEGSGCPDVSEDVETSVLLPVLKSGKCSDYPEYLTCVMLYCWNVSEDSPDQMKQCWKSILNTIKKKNAKIIPEKKVTEEFTETITLKTGTSQKVNLPYIGFPKPTVSWTGPDNKMPPFKIETKPDITTINFDKVINKDKGNYTLNVKNQHGEATLTVLLKVLDKPGKPRNFKVTENLGDNVTLTWDAPEDFGGYQEVEYVVELREMEKRSNQSVTVTKDVTITVEKLVPDKKYTFYVAAKNECGQSDFTEVTATLKYPYGKPKSPITVTAKVNEKDVDVTWSPVDDTPVTNYHLQMKPEKEKNWQDVNTDFTITETNFTVKDLPENILYHFRVIPENKVGKGEPSKSSNSVMLGEPLKIIRELTDQIVSSLPSNVTLESELNRPVDTAVAWMKDKKSLTPGKNVKIEKDGPIHRVVITEVKEENIGSYTMSVENLSTTGQLNIQVAPELKLPEHFEDNIVMPAGTSKVIEVPFIANPKPDVKWTYGPSEMKPRFKTDVVAGLTSISLGKVKREDSGDYKLTIKNDVGDNTLTLHVTVLDKPSPPRNLVGKNNVGDAIDIEWKKPEDLGGYESCEYVVELRESTKKSSQPWKTLSEKETHIDKLTQEKKYVFRVAAKNPAGQSDFVETQPILMKLNFNKPKTPIEAAVTGKEVEVTWQPGDDSPVSSEKTTDRVLAPLLKSISENQIPKSEEKKDEDKMAQEAVYFNENGTGSADFNKNAKGTAI